MAKGPRKGGRFTGFRGTEMQHARFGPTQLRILETLAKERGRELHRKELRRKVGIPRGSFDAALRRLVARRAVRIVNAPDLPVHGNVVLWRPGFAGTNIADREAFHQLIVRRIRGG